MHKYVIDSVVLIAVFNPRDQYNQKAMPLVKKVDDGVIGQVIITDYIFDEILTFIKAKVGHEKAVTVMNAILSSSYIPIKKISEEVFNSAIILFECMKNSVLLMLQL